MSSFRLSADDVKAADGLAAMRHNMQQAKGAKHVNNLECSDEHSLLIGKHGTRAEMAWHLLHPHQHWEWLSENPGGKADFEGFIDIKSIAQPTHRLIVPDVEPAKLQDFWAYVLAYLHPIDEVDGSMLVTFMGWAWGWRIAHHGKRTELQPGRPCWVLETKNLSSMSLLESIVAAKGAVSNG